MAVAREWPIGSGVEKPSLTKISPISFPGRVVTPGADAGEAGGEATFDIRPVEGRAGDRPAGGGSPPQFAAVPGCGKGPRAPPAPPAAADRQVAPATAPRPQVPQGL